MNTKNNEIIRKFTYDRCGEVTNIEVELLHDNDNFNLFISMYGSFRYLLKDICNFYNTELCDLLSEIDFKLSGISYVVKIGHDRISIKYDLVKEECINTNIKLVIIHNKNLPEDQLDIVNESIDRISEIIDTEYEDLFIYDTEMSYNSINIYLSLRFISDSCLEVIATPIDRNKINADNRFELTASYMTIHTAYVNEYLEDKGLYITGVNDIIINDLYKKRILYNISRHKPIRKFNVNTDINL